MAMTTKERLIRAACAALVVSIAGVAHSQEARDASLEVTIRLLPENATRPDEITRRIELPPAAANPAAPPARPAEDGPGRDENNGRGRDVAEEARERGREFGQEVSEQARENRENAGRPDDRGPPEDRGRPDDQGPPPGQPQGPPATPPGRP
jgi:hypothetical protein